VYKNQEPLGAFLKAWIGCVRFQRLSRSQKTGECSRTFNGQWAPLSKVKKYQYQR